MRSKIISAAVAALAAVASGAVAGPATAAPPDSQQSKFAALRHAPTPNVPAGVKRFLARRTDEGVDVSQTRRVAAPDGGSWDVTPGDGHICLYVEREETGACATTADALAGRLTFLFVEPSTDPKVDSVPTDTPRFQVGLLPDGTASTSAKSRLSGDIVTAKSNSDGLYRLSSIGGLGAVTMHRATGRSLRITAAAKRMPAVKPGARAAYSGYITIPSPPWVGMPYAFYSGLYGAFATITNIRIGSWDTNTICGNARNPNQTWGDNFFCTAAQYIQVDHAFNGTARSGWAGPGGYSASVLGVAWEWFNSI